MKKTLSPAPMMEHVHEKDIVMVCVTRQRTCARLVECGEEIARARNLPLHIVHAVKTGENFLGNAVEGEALEYLFTAAQLAGGSLAMLRADDVEGTLETYAKAHKAAVLVLGASPSSAEDSFVSQIKRRLPEMQVEIV